MKEKGETVEARETDLDEKEEKDNTGKTLKGKMNYRSYFPKCVNSANTLNMHTSHEATTVLRPP